MYHVNAHDLMLFSLNCSAVSCR